MMVVCVDTGSDRSNDRQMVHLFRCEWQMLTDGDAVGGCYDRRKRTTILRGRIRLEIPHVDVR